MKKEREFTNEQLKEMAAAFHHAMTTGCHYSPSKYMRERFNLNMAEFETVNESKDFNEALKQLSIETGRKAHVNAWMQTIDFGYAKSQGVNMEDLLKEFTKETAVQIDAATFAELINQNPEAKELNF